MWINQKSNRLIRDCFILSMFTVSNRRDVRNLLYHLYNITKNYLQMQVVCFIAIWYFIDAKYNRVSWINQVTTSYHTIYLYTSY